jgi:hypothetical protein
LSPAPQSAERTWVGCGTEVSNFPWHFLRSIDEWASVYLSHKSITGCDAADLKRFEFQKTVSLGTHQAAL